MILSIKDLHATIENKAVLNGVNLEVGTQETHVLMGPNGAGKTSLAMSLMGHPNFQITKGTVQFTGKDLLLLKPHQRAQAGLFLSFQQPCEIEGVCLADLLRQAYNSIYNNTEKQLKLSEFRQFLDKICTKLKLLTSFVERDVNFGFSGGEKKRAEMLQLMVLQPKLAILDEIDSGLDVDALTTVCKAINELRNSPSKTSFLIITHYKHLLDRIAPDAVHVMKNGKVVESGKSKLAHRIVSEGFNQK
ncbi:Fe-S cluster assembly ATPase SufC [Candidatus Babeliales bacterium]|nr:Fe-S cluster assembly ATPase SufC [Candidatus Babeliales bacterium]